MNYQMWTKVWAVNEIDFTDRFTALNSNFLLLSLFFSIYVQFSPSALERELFYHAISRLKFSLLIFHTPDGHKTISQRGSVCNERQVSFEV